MSDKTLRLQEEGIRQMDVLIEISLDSSAIHCYLLTYSKSKNINHLKNKAHKGVVVRKLTKRTI